MRRSFIGTVALAGMLLSACAASAAPSSTTRAKAGGYPVVLRSDGVTTSLVARPDRILSLSPSSTQMLYAIGAGHQVVGVDKYSTYPPDAPRTRFTGAETSAEDYLPLRPDLVILAFSSGTLVSQLEKLHIPTLLLPPASGIAGAERQIALLGKATHHAAQATAAIASINSYVARVVKSVGSRGRGATYYFELSPDFYTATSHTYVGAVLGSFGMKDIADPAGHGSDFPQLSPEYIVKANPDYVFLADTVCCKQSAESFAARPGLSVLRAVRDGHVVALNDSVASEWGPHSLETLLSDVADVLEGEKPPSPAAENG